MAGLAGMAGAGRRRGTSGGASAPPGTGARAPCLTVTHGPWLTVTHRFYLADSGPFPRRNPALRSGEVLVLGIMKYADLDVLKYVIHAKEYHVHEERRDGASPARRTRERRWRAIVRVYDRLGQPFQSRLVNNFMAHGTTILMSLDTFPGGTPYSAIAAGQQDATITAFLESMNSSAIHNGLPAIYFTFEHEANVAANHQGLGTAAQFIAAWDH